MVTSIGAIFASMERGEAWLKIRPAEYLFGWVSTSEALVLRRANYADLGVA